jgi:hypothetical protein
VVRGVKPVYLIAVSILAGCGGAGGPGTQQVSGPGYGFRAPLAWTVSRTATATTASSGPVSLVQVQTFRLLKPYRAELFAAASGELDRVAAKLAAQLGGRVDAGSTVKVDGRDARTYGIAYRGRMDEITFVLDGMREYELLCRRPAGSDDAVCRRFVGSFALG